MLQLAADENFNGDIVRGLLLRRRDVDLVRVQDFGLAGADDAEILAWAAENDFILLTHDRATMPDAAYQRVVDGLSMPGVFILDDRFPVGAAVNEIIFILDCSEPIDWKNTVVYLPL